MDGIFRSHAVHRPLPTVYRYLLRPLLFRLDAEAAHGLGVRAARLGQRMPGVVRTLFRTADPEGRLTQTLWTREGRPGLHFTTPVGLAAGFDKNAALVPFWAALGFGFAEVGSVTAQPSAGNARPRAFRLPDDRALINRMGLNNEGAAAVAARLASLQRPEGFVVGVNVAKTHDPAILGEDAVADFRTSVRLLLPHADYLTLNVSCPNTAEGKTFETPDALDALLSAVMEEHEAQSSRVPVLVKLSPPLSDHDFGAFDELVAISRGYDVEGFIATNTASDRTGLRTDAVTLDAIGRGGVSGVDSPQAAYEKIRAGASLVELYTALVYEGPGLVRRITRGLVRLLDRDGFGSINEAVGNDAG